MAKLAAGAIGAALLGLAAAACGGSNAKTPTPVIPTPTGTPGDPASTAAFDSLAKKFGTLDAYHLVYDLKIDDTKNGTLSATLSFDVKGKTTRSEFDGTVGSTHEKLLTIFDGNDLYVCDEVAARDCTQTKAGATLRDPLGVYSPHEILASVLASQNITVHPAANQTIAGIAAKCFLLNQTTAQSTYCFDPKTALLLLIQGKIVSGSNSTTTTITAAQASTTVTSIDLKPPYPVVTATVTGG